MAGLPAVPWERVVTALRHTAQGVFGLAPYRLTLLGRRPATLRLTPVDAWPGDADTGSAISQGRFIHFGYRPQHGQDVWNPPGAAAEWIEAMHDFAWLRDLRALGGGVARRTARTLAADWMDHNAAWSLPAWRSDIIAARLVAWLCHYETFFASGDDAFRGRLVASMAAQHRHLARAIRLECRGAARITGYKGLIYGMLCLDGEKEALERWLSRLAAELDRQVLADGGLIERSPALQVSVLRDLLDIRAMLGAGRSEIPDPLQKAIDRMSPMLRFLRLGDGGLPRFNDSGEGDPAQIDSVLAQTGPRGKPAARAPHVGFEKLAAGDLLVMVDCGAPPPPPFDDHAHAGTLSLEVCVGAERLIVNCGAAPVGGAVWRRAQRSTAAHSTMVVADRNSSEIGEDGRIGRRRASVVVQRESDDGAALVTLRHDGYAASDGIVHQRRLFLSRDDEYLRGEDSLSGPAGVPFALRFHLHPAVRASVLKSRRAALLRLPRGGGWRLRADAAMELADSIYFSDGPEPRRTGQIVIAGITEQGTTTVKWALHREGD